MSQKTQSRSLPRPPCMQISQSPGLQECGWRAAGVSKCLLLSSGADCPGFTQNSIASVIMYIINGGRLWGGGERQRFENLPE